MARFSFTLSGGLGDFILAYLGSPGVHLHFIEAAAPGQIDYRLFTPNQSCVDLVFGSPFFRNARNFYEHKEGEYPQGLLDNDIRLIRDLGDIPRLQIQPYLDPEEENAIASIRRPYAVLHPFASSGGRCMSAAYDVELLARAVADISGTSVVVLGSEDFQSDHPKVIKVTGSSRLAVRIVQQAAFVVATHSSMACAAWVYGVPCMCLGPSWLVAQEFISQGNYERYLAPLFRPRNAFFGFDLAGHFEAAFRRFLVRGTSLSPRPGFRPSLSRPSCCPCIWPPTDPGQTSGPAPA